MGTASNVVVKTYKGTQTSATVQFQKDAQKMAAQRYFPTSQTWAPGSYGCGYFLFALVLCFLLIGVLIFIYMLLVKPPGTLTVTYEYKPLEALKQVDEEKTCPQCAEGVKAAAKICRFCGHNF